jgi:site-specific recombinase XerD
VIAEDTNLLSREEVSRLEVKRQISRSVNSKKRGIENKNLRFKELWCLTIQWLIFLKKLSPKQTEKSEAVRSTFPLVLRYVDFLKDERLATPASAIGRERIAVDFLYWLMSKNVKLEDLLIETADEYIKFKGENCARRSMSTYVCGLKCFLKFCEMRSVYKSSVAAALQGPRLFRFENLPLGPSWKSVQQLLTLPDVSTATGARNRAIMLLLSVYAMRSSEVTALKLDDINWNEETITLVRAKTQRRQVFPLTKEVGEALIKHLEKRPRATAREIFLKFQTPVGPMKPASLGHITKRYYQQAGLKPPHWGPHSLRHACATELMSRQLPLKEIADHLGQFSLESTRVYAKVDLNGLRQVGNFDLGGLI